MNSLRTYVDGLFAGYKNSPKNCELRDEILSNLEAKVADLVAGGMAREDAVRTAKESITSIDYLVEGGRKIYINQYRIELSQIALLYTLVAWIITIPLGVIQLGFLTHLALFGAVIATAILYLGLRLVLSNSHIMVAYDMDNARHNTKLAWIVWGLFIIVSTLFTIAQLFGSDIWFGRNIIINGPDQFAVLAVRFALPFVSIIIPLLFNASLALVKKYEVGEFE